MCFILAYIATILSQHLLAQFVVRVPGRATTTMEGKHADFSDLYKIHKYVLFKEKTLTIGLEAASVDRQAAAWFGATVIDRAKLFGIFGKLSNWQLGISRPSSGQHESSDPPGQTAQW